MFVFFTCNCENNCSKGCQASKKSDLVLEDFGCHPKCRPVGLQKWCLKLATGKYKIKGK